MQSFEETAEANWAVPHQCADGSTVEARLLVRTTRFHEYPDTEDATPTVRVQYQAVCSGSSFSWIRAAAPATITSTPNLKSVTATGSATVRDNLGVFHQVSFDATWTGVGELQTSTSPIQRNLVGTSIRKQRDATATGQVTFDGTSLVDGEANHRITPFIRTDEERYADPPA